MKLGEHKINLISLIVILLVVFCVASNIGASAVTLK